MLKHNKSLIALIKKTRMPLAIFIIALAIFFSLFRALTPWVKQYKGEIENHLSAVIGQPVTINTMETSWYWFEPVLKLNQVTLSDAQNHILKLDKLLVGINLLSSLWHWEIQPGILYVKDVHITLRQTNDHWQLDGFRADKQLTTIGPDVYLPVVSWLLTQQKIIVKRVSAHIYNKDGMVLHINNINFNAVNRSGHYRLKSNANLEQSIPTQLSVLADFYADPKRLDRTKGHVYLSIKNIFLTQWQSFSPISSYALKEGNGNLDFWIDIDKGHLSNVQTEIDLRQLDWLRVNNKVRHRVDALKANLAWKPSRDGWELAGDKIFLNADGFNWPENQMMITFNELEQSYSLFVKHLILQPIFKLGIEWPDTFKSLLAYKPVGELQNTQIKISQNKIDLFLTQFIELGWQGRKTIPSINNLSGVLHWQPTEGRLDLDAKDVLFINKNAPALTINQINTTVDWKELSHGLRINVERFVLSHPDLVLSARGTFDKGDTPSDGILHLTAEYSASNAQQWFAYLPSAYLKPRLNEWLTKDVKKINKMAGRLRLKGALADFPFDKKPGELLITTHLSGVDAFINKHWPINRDIDAWLRIDKRSLTVDVQHANLKGMIIDQLALHMDEIGMDRETLLIHGKVKSQADKLKDYVFSSPLKTNLERLKMVDIKGDVAVDFHLNVPLFPGNNSVLANGTLTFEENKLLIHHALNDIEVDKLNGILAFDEHGVTDSALQAILFDDPITMHIKSIREKKPFTEIRIAGSTTIDVLKNKLNLPIFSFMQGKMAIESVLKLTADPHDLDNITILTSLEGTAIDLPKPVGKDRNESKPLKLDIDFNPEKGFSLRMDYSNTLTSDIWFERFENWYQLKKGEIRLGNGIEQNDNHTGLSINGTIPEFDADKWQKSIEQMSSGSTSSSIFKTIKLVDVVFGSIKIKNHEYKQVSVKAVRHNDSSWGLALRHADVDANLQYQLVEKTLSGHVNYLNLNKTIFKEKWSNNGRSELKPENFPNLELSIDAVSINGINMGAIQIKATHSPNTWRVDSLKIKSADYQINLKGDWFSEGTVNKTTIQASAHIGSLANCLKRLSITPVVEAHHGDVQLNASWTGGFHAFSLAKTKGELFITLKNGRITNLSPETEEKLGMGKLLSILSLQTIPRRLKLDFTDLSKDGYSFDIFKGSFTLNNGVLTTKESYIDGPVAYASMSGSLNIVKQLYDVDLQVSPHITASLPVVATIAGGPIAGIATWIASRMINRTMQKVSAYTYKVSGPWHEPLVQQVSIIKKEHEKN